MLRPKSFDGYCCPTSSSKPTCVAIVTSACLPRRQLLPTNAVGVFLHRSIAFLIPAILWNNSFPDCYLNLVCAATPQYRLPPANVVGVLAKRSGPVRLSRVARPPLRSVVFFLKMPFRLKNSLVLMTDGRASPRRTICGSRGEHWPNLFHEYRTASWLISMPCSCSRFPTLRSDSGKLM